MSVSTGGFGQLSYGSFYLPSLSFGYLSTQPSNPLLKYIPHIDFLGLDIDSIHLLYFLTVFTLLGAIQIHGVGRAIFGPEGPVARPKNTAVKFQHELAIILNEPPEDIPIVPCRIASHGWAVEFLDYIDYLRKKQFHTMSSDSNTKRRLRQNVGPIPARHRFETGFVQLKELAKMINRRKIPRILYFLPMGLQKRMAWVAMLFLIASIVLGNISYIALVLTLALGILLLRRIFWAPIPGYTNAEALDDRFIPEYKRRELDDRE